MHQKQPKRAAISLINSFLFLALFCAVTLVFCSYSSLNLLLLPLHCILILLAFTVVPVLFHSFKKFFGDTSSLWQAIVIMLPFLPMTTALIAKVVWPNMLVAPLVSFNFVLLAALSSLIFIFLIVDLMGKNYVDSAKAIRCFLIVAFIFATCFFGCAAFSLMHPFLIEAPVITLSIPILFLMTLIVYKLIYSASTDNYSVGPLLPNVLPMPIQQQPIPLTQINEQDEAYSLKLKIGELESRIRMDLLKQLKANGDGDNGSTVTTETTIVHEERKQDGSVTPQN